MTSSHPWIADGFFLSGSVLFLAKFLTWEDARLYERVKRAQIIQNAFIATILILFGAIGGNHYLNRPTTSGQTQATLPTKIPSAPEIPNDFANRPPQTPKPVQKPKIGRPSRDIADFDDEQLAEWGVSLMKTIKNLIAQEEQGIPPASAAAGPTRLQMARMSAINLYNAFMNCCYEDSLKYRKEVISRLGGGQGNAEVDALYSQMKDCRNGEDISPEVSCSTFIRTFEEDIEDLTSKLRRKSN